MFGNTKGWITSGVIAVLMGSLIFMTSRLPSPTPPTGRFPQALKAIELPVDPTTLLKPTGDTDASDLYRKAIAEYKKNPKLYDAKTGDKPDVAKYPAVQYLVDATNCSKLTLFTANPGYAISYSSENPELDALDKVGNTTSEIGAKYLTANPELARKLLNADFALGQKMVQERAVWDEFNNGVNHMITCCTGFKFLAKKANDGAAVDAAQAFIEKVGEYKGKTLAPVALTLTRSADPATVGFYGGDLFQIARMSPERVWKVDAVLALGRMKFASSSRGDQILATRHLKDWLKDPDPCVRYAAKLADDLTILDFRKLGN